jgi:hypothetical protein
MLLIVDWCLGTYVLEQAVGLIFKNKADQEKVRLLSSAETSVTNHQSTLLKSQKSENITHTAAEA